MFQFGHILFFVLLFSVFFFGGGSAGRFHSYLRLLDDVEDELKLRGQSISSV